VYEVLALLAGVIIGLIAQHLHSIQLKSAVVTVGSVVVGAIVSFISGELAVSWAYLVFDMAQVLIAAGVTMVLGAWWRRRSTIMVGRRHE
jgi:hypothetical protein